jgi:hypothetical protein
LEGHLKSKGKSAAKYNVPFLMAYVRLPGRGAADLKTHLSFGDTLSKACTMLKTPIPNWLGTVFLSFGTPKTEPRFYEGTLLCRAAANAEHYRSRPSISSPLISNLYLTEVDRMLERAMATTRQGKYTAAQYARYADDLVILVDAHPRHAWLMKAVDKRLIPRDYSTDRNSERAPNSSSMSDLAPVLAN